MNKKSVFSAMLVSLLALSLIVGLTSCGGSNPKALAKENYKLTMQVLEATTKLDFAKMNKLEQKVIEIEAKVEKLSGIDQGVYAMELARLSGF